MVFIPYTFTLRQPNICFSLFVFYCVNPNNTFTMPPSSLILGTETMDNNRGALTICRKFTVKMGLITLNVVLLENMTKCHNKV